MLGRLLIWEECHCESIPSSGLLISRTDNSEVRFEGWEGCWMSPESRISQVDAQAAQSIHILVNKMMMNNHVNIVGEGYEYMHMSFFSFSFLSKFAPTSL